MRVFGKEYAPGDASPAAPVLLVDGDRERAAQVGALVEASGARVATATGARDALRRPLPEVLLCAAGLPDGDGFDLVDELQRRGGRLAAILYTDAPSYSSCRRAWQLGAIDLLATPLDRGALTAALERAGAGAAGANHSSPADAWTPAPGSDDDVLRELVALGVRAGLGPAARARLASAASEALDNARRHAAAAQVSVGATVDRGHVAVLITDNGCGFDPLEAELDAAPAALAGVAPTPGGLARMRALADDLRIESTPGSGTRVELRIAPHTAALDGGDDSDLSDRDWLDPDLARRLLLSPTMGREQNSDSQLPPALTVALGRLMAVATPSRLAQRALWS